MAIVKIPPYQGPNWIFQQGDFLVQEGVLGQPNIPPDGEVAIPQGYIIGGGGFGAKNHVAEVGVTVKLPPLELNMAAKPLNPFEDVLSMEDLKRFRKEGRYLEYNYPLNGIKTKWVREPMPAQYKWSQKDLNEIFKDGAFVHKTKKTMVYRPAAFDFGGVVLWDTCLETLNSHDQDDGFVKWFGAAAQIIYEGVDFGI